MTKEVYRIQGDSAIVTAEHAAVDLREIFNRLSPLSYHIRASSCECEEEAISFETGRLTGITEMFHALLEREGIDLICFAAKGKTNPEEKIFQVEIRVPKIV